MQSGHLFCSCLVHSALSRDSVMKYESTISLARNFIIWFWSSHLEYVSGPSAAHCFGFFLHLFPLLRKQWSKRKGRAVLNVFKLFNVASYMSVFSLGTFSFYAFGDDCSWCTCNVQTANLETCICKQRNWKHNISIILLSQLYQKGQDRFPRY